MRTVIKIKTRKNKTFGLAEAESVAAATDNVDMKTLQAVLAALGITNTVQEEAEMASQTCDQQMRELQKQVTSILAAGATDREQVEQQFHAMQKALARREEGRQRLVVSREENIRGHEGIKRRVTELLVQFSPE